MLILVFLFLCPSLVFAFMGRLLTGGKPLNFHLSVVQKPRALDSQPVFVSSTDWPGCTPTKSIATTRKVRPIACKPTLKRVFGAASSGKSNTNVGIVDESTQRKHSEAEIKATMTAMKKMQYFERQEDNPDLETGHADDELGFVSPTFRSGFVSILGNANVGKSTLMNHLLGQDLSIVSPKPQTTRHKIFGILTKMPENITTIDFTVPEDSKERSHIQKDKVIPLYQYQQEGYQMVFADTPGMLAPAYKLQEVMQNTVRVAAKDGDVILLVTDVYGEPLMDVKVMKRLVTTDRPVVVAINKVDLAAKHTLESSAATDATADPVSPISCSEAENKSSSTQSAKKVKPTAQSFAAIQSLWRSRLPNAVILGISALHGTGVPFLLHQLLQHLSFGPLYYPKDSVADRDERFFATEIIRECVLKLYQEEIPYSCEVVMNSFEDKSDNFSVLHASVIVARQSQKAIIIGTRGSKLAQLGTMARQKIEKFLGRKIYLDIQVKVDEEWRGKEQSLTKYGYIKK